MCVFLSFFQVKKVSLWKRNSAQKLQISKKNVVPAGAIRIPPPRMAAMVSTVGTIGSVASLHEYGTRENNYFRTQDNNDTKVEYV